MSEFERVYEAAVRNSWNRRIDAYNRAVRKKNALANDLQYHAEDYFESEDEILNGMNLTMEHVDNYMSNYERVNSEIKNIERLEYDINVLRRQANSPDISEVNGTLTKYIDEHGEPDSWPNPVLEFNERDARYDWRDGAKVYLDGVNRSRLFFPQIKRVITLFSNYVLISLALIFVVVTMLSFLNTAFPDVGLFAFFANLTSPVVDGVRDASGVLGNVLTVIMFVLALPLILLFAMVLLIAALSWMASKINPVVGYIAVVILLIVMFGIIFYGYMRLMEKVENKKKDDRYRTVGERYPHPIWDSIVAVIVGILVMIASGANSGLVIGKQLKVIDGADLFTRYAFFLDKSNNPLIEKIFSIAIAVYIVGLALTFVIFWIKRIKNNRQGYEDYKKEYEKRERVYAISNSWVNAWLAAWPKEDTKQ